MLQEKNLIFWLGMTICSTTPQSSIGVIISMVLNFYKVFVGYFSSPYIELVFSTAILTFDSNS